MKPALAGLKRYCVAALWLSALLAQPATAQQSLNVVSWDGAYVKSQILGFIRPYEEATGHRINVIQYSGGIDTIRQQVRAWNVSWDVVDLELFDAMRACKEGLLETIDHSILTPAPDGTPAAEDFIELGQTPCGVGNVVGSTVVGYRQNSFKQKPTQLEDLFDLKRFPGRRGLRKSPKGNLEWALISDGVAVDEVYPLLSTEAGLKRAFAVLDKIKPHVDWWETGQQAVHMLESGRVAMSSVYSGRIAAAAERGQPLEILWDHQIWYYDVWAIPKNGRNTELAMDFVRHASSTESLAAQARYIPYGPLRRSSVALLEPALREQLPTSQKHLATAVKLDAKWWSEHLDSIAPRFSRWLERPVMVPKSLPR
ncbi:ABC transporter substrate-binding protein [Parahaliea sp. F7430]|uniref:ABC transporter substrate-binding protein n=1 Tax=Sediminihaliea albiluteola TaxID=2758564 RepID=A0A7W2TTG9_9GAMM|nr:ABC transporter substrate-binding protein [Sediminihaliea albiluteola]MBA6411641.1 ABC transporter substrate-binding protein [Sediminihaliea albiluteola]